MTTKNPVSKVVRSRLEKTMSLIECPCMANYEIRNETSCRRCHKYASRYQRAIDRKETCSRKLAEDYVSTVSRK